MLCGMQAALLAGVGLQRMSLNDMGSHLNLAPPQTKALFDKVPVRAQPHVALHSGSRSC